MPLESTCVSRLKQMVFLKALKSDKIMGKTL